MAKVTFNLVAVVKKGEGEQEKKFFNPVGKIIVHDSGKTGVCFLNHLPGVEYALFIQDPKKKGENADAGDAAGE